MEVNRGMQRELCIFTHLRKNLSSDNTATAEFYNILVLMKKLPSLFARFPFLHVYASVCPS